jgi:hypothetical protein
MNEIDFDTIGKVALGGLLVLTAVFTIALLTVRELWRWARGHLATFDQVQAVAKGGKIQIGATIEDMRVPAQAPKGAEVVNLDERREAGGS